MRDEQFVRVVQGRVFIALATVSGRSELDPLISASRKFPDARTDVTTSIQVCANVEPERQPEPARQAHWAAKHRLRVTRPLGSRPRTLSGAGSCWPAPPRTGC